MLPNLGRPSKQNARAHTHTEALTDPHSIDRRAARLSTRRQFTHKRRAHAAAPTAAAQPAAWLVFINCSVYFASAVACQLTETIKLIDINNCCCCSFVSISSRFVSFQFVPFRSVSSQVLRLCARARASSDLDIIIIGAVIVVGGGVLAAQLVDMEMSTQQQQQRRQRQLNTTTQLRRHNNMPRYARLAAANFANCELCLAGDFVVVVVA